MEENNNLNTQPVEEEEKKKKKCGFLIWWNKLSKKTKIAISAGGAVVLTSAIVFPILGATVWSNKAKRIEAKWNNDAETYLTEDLGNVSAGTKFVVTIIYATEDTIGFNSVMAGSQSVFTIGLNNPSADINVTQFKNTKGADITNNWQKSPSYNWIYSDTHYKENVTVTFSINKSFSSPFYFGARDSK